ncbi:MAG: glycosyltransferase family 4 protein [Prevotellaceae bacterium]|jgi:glycosyltransferase involved in cell wall biosynthesis|nr:glycosyltransferase family 4 protein [Prevotellaceae bacterium]
MKIAVTGTRGIPDILGGVETHCEELFPLIAAKGYDVTLVRRSAYARDSRNEYKGVKLIDLYAPKSKSFEAFTHTFAAVLKARRLNVDILHVHAIGPALVIPIARMLGLKVVFTHHGQDYNREKWGRTAKTALKLGERMGCMFANEVIVISEAIKDCVKSKYGRTDVRLIRNGVPAPVFVPETRWIESLGVRHGEYIFAMGRFVPEKNFHLLIETFASLNQSACKLVLAGDADMENTYSSNLKECAHKNGVILTGFIKGEKLHALLTHARAFVLPSTHEGLPISLLEAMSYSLPVIASNISANLETELSPDSYFRVGDRQHLSEKIETIISTPFHRVKYSMEDYRWDKIAEQTIEVYKEMFS